MIGLYLLAFTISAYGATVSPLLRPETQRAKALEEYIKKEKPRFKKREGQRKDLLESLDKLNSEQNEVRDRIAEMKENRQELTMALENLSVEFEKEKALEVREKERLVMLLKVVYQVKKDGILRFLALGDNLGTFATRVRVLYRTLRARSVLSAQFEERARRLKQSESKLLSARVDMQEGLANLEEQEDLLSDLQQKKKDLLSQISQRQSHYKMALEEYRRISRQLSALFNHFEASRESDLELLPAQRSLPLPIDSGKIVKSFGRNVHRKFGTVTYQKGIEIEADEDTPVTAILPGTVEFDGWVKGLGNVIILHHGGGFYSLSGHLHKTLKAKGDSVQQGDPIGLVGDTGNSETPSLYFELRQKGKAVDPGLYFAPDQFNALL